MARKTSLSLENLNALGAEKLAGLIFDETEINAAFRKRVKGALAGLQGSDAIAVLIDRRLAALERARAMIGWEKERGFAEDLGATVETIVKELGGLDARSAVQRLLRFINTHGTVFERIDDSGGRIQEVYWRAADALPELVQALPPDDRADIPNWLMVSLSKDTHGLAERLAVSIVPFLTEPVLAEWDRQLDANKGDDAALMVRQAIARARGDIDLYMALEERRPAWRQDPLLVAEMLLAANRLDEALAWARRERKGGIVYATAADIADGRINRPHDANRVALEARILEAMNDRAAAQSLRWATFECTLHAPTLRDYLRKLEDFIEYEEQERAFALADTFHHPYVALSFFIEWPKLDCAAKLVLDKRTQWDGRHYGTLGEAAPALEEKHPLAASLLYRALLNDILVRAKSKAYGHGTRYLGRLEALASLITDWDGEDDHAAYALGLRKAHGRKAGFWNIADGNISR
jgi:hypothetical protein